MIRVKEFIILQKKEIFLLYKRIVELQQYGVRNQKGNYFILKKNKRVIVFFIPKGQMCLTFLVDGLL